MTSVGPTVIVQHLIEMQRLSESRRSLTLRRRPKNLHFSCQKATMQTKVNVFLFCFHSIFLSIVNHLWSTTPLETSDSYFLPASPVFLLHSRNYWGRKRLSGTWSHSVRCAPSPRISKACRCFILLPAQPIQQEAAQDVKATRVRGIVSPVNFGNLML